MKIQHLSSQYTVRDLHPEDAAMIFELLKHNTIFYQYHPPMVTVESILEDMEALPPNMDYEDKHYIGFFQNNTLVAVMDFLRNGMDWLLRNEYQTTREWYRYCYHFRHHELPDTTWV